MKELVITDTRVKAAIEDTARIFETFNVTKHLIIFEKKTDCELLNDYKEKYSIKFIFDQFVNKKDFKELFLPLIDPNQYKKALDEFVKFGQLMYFPKDLVYKWLGIVLKNTVLIVNSSMMKCYYKYISQYYVKDILIPYSFKDIDVNFIDERTVEYRVPLNGKTEEDIDKENEDVNNLMNEISPAPGGWVLNYSTEKPPIFFNNKIIHYYLPIDENKKYSFYFAKIEGDNVKIIERAPTIVEKIGFNKWTEKYGYTEQLGLSQILNQLSTLKDNMTPEEILVWINKFLDIYHFNSEMSELFIKNGKESLNKISN